MANIVTKTVILDSPKNAIVAVYMQSDGVEGELSSFVLVDPSTDFNDSPLGLRMSVLQVWHSFSWFDGLLTFADTQNYPAWQLTRDTINYSDFRYFGGIKDGSDMSGTGQLLLTTNGFSVQAGNVGTLIVEVRKNNPQTTGVYTPPLPPVFTNRSNS